MWLRVPEVPLTATVVVVAVTDEAADTVTVCGVPGATDGLAGETVTPEGSPVICIETLELNPFSAVTDIETVAVFPPAIVRLPGDSESVKSGDGGGLPPPDPPVLPHPERINPRHMPDSQRGTE